MNFALTEAIADAVLFEGYILYPYRPSSLKNRQRWNFGTLYPKEFAQAQSPQERSHFRAEVLLHASLSTKLNLRLRFLQLFTPPRKSEEASWAEGFARSRTLEGLMFDQLHHGVERELDLSTLVEEESSTIPPGFLPQPRYGRLKLCTELLHHDVYRIAVTLTNESPAPAIPSLSRHTVQNVAFVSAHLMLEAEDGEFISLLEPSLAEEADARACEQDGVFPVLVGRRGDRSHVLCSPIILYDYPEIAPESAGDFFDSTEMDEMLALRILTLTQKEKEEICSSDPHARTILERTETLPHEQFARMHGAVRGLRHSVGHESANGSSDMIDQPFDPFTEHIPVTSVRVFGTDLRTGDRVRLWPQKSADILDVEMAGKSAIIEAIEQDIENNLLFAVVLEDDPGRDMGMLRQTGHRFFFTPEEIEPLNREDL